MKRSAAVQIIVALLVSALARPSVGVAATPVTALTQVSLAATGPRVAVFVVPLDLSASQQQGALEGAAEAALVRAERFTVVPVQDAFNPEAARQHAAAVDGAREKLKTGKQAIDELDNVKATADFKDALEALQGADLTREFPALLDAWTMKAAGHATGGENGPAKKDMEAVIALAPRAEFSPTFFPPELLKFAEAQRKQAANAKGELLVRTEPPGARVWVDGQLRGISPVTVAGLSAAKHFVTASLGGYALAQAQVSPGEAQLDLELSELAQPWKKALLDIKRDPEGQVRDTAAQSVGKAAQLEQLVLVIARKSVAGEQLELIGVRLESSDGHNAGYRVGTVNPGDPDALAGFFDGLAAKDDKRDGKNPVHHYKGAEGLDVRQVATYSLLGGGAAFIIAGIILGSVAAVNHDIFLRTPQAQFGPSRLVANIGFPSAVAADVSYGVGIAALAAGAVLFFTKPSAGGDAAPQKAEAPKPREPEKKPAATEDKQEEKTREDDARAAEEKKKRDDDAAAANAKKEEEEKKKLSKKEQAALEKKEREEAERKAKEEERQRKEDEKRAAEEEKKRKEEEKRQAAEEEKRRREEEKKASKGQSKKEREEAERRAKEEEEARLKAEEEAKAKEAAEKKRRDDEERKRREAEEKKRREEDHDDLRNY